jgi:hypothetical protein
MDQFHTILQQLSRQSSSAAAASAGDTHAHDDDDDDDDDIKNTLKFTESAVAGLRQAYFAYMQQVASSLTEWDDLKKDNHKIVEALGIDDPEFEKWTQQAQELVVASQQEEEQQETAKGRPKKQRKRRRGAITAEMEAEQERLLKQSKATVLLEKERKET